MVRFDFAFLIGLDKRAIIFFFFIFTKDSEDDETITGFQSIKYKADLTLPAFAKWAMLLSLPKMVRIDFAFLIGLDKRAIIFFFYLH